MVVTICASDRIEVVDIERGDDSYVEASKIFLVQEISPEEYEE